MYSEVTPYRRLTGNSTAYSCAKNEDGNDFTERDDLLSDCAESPNDELTLQDLLSTHNIHAQHHTKFLVEKNIINASALMRYVFL